MRIAVVIQRYGREITGGSESLCRETMRRLARKHTVTVYTTTALDYVTWRNHYAAGEEQDEGVTVRRFRVIRERDNESFNRYSEWIYTNEHSEVDEMKWLEMQGPVCPDLVDALRLDQTQFDIVLFYTYLYYPIVMGLRVVSKPVVLVPTAHREPAATLGMYREVYRRPDGLIFNTHAEERLVEEVHRPRADQRLVGGIGINPPDKANTAARLKAPCLLYAGRIDAGKGCAELFEFFIRFRIHVMPCKLYLMGSVQMPIPKHPDIRYLGFVGEDEKFANYRAAGVTVIPSRFESLSIVALESLVCSTPILVSAGCEVLKDHCLRGNAGLFYENFDEFAETLALLFRKRELAMRLGASGRRYVLDNYTWEKVLGRYESILQRVVSSDLRPDQPLNTPGAVL